MKVIVTVFTKTRLLVTVNITQRHLRAYEGQSRKYEHQVISFRGSHQSHEAAHEFIGTIYHI